LIGTNGAGKTTLFDVIGGFLTPDTGWVEIAGQRTTGLPPHSVARLGVARLFQEIRLARALPVYENVAIGVKRVQGEPSERLRALLANMGDRSSRHQPLLRRLLELIGLQEKYDVPAGTLSYGQQKLLAFVMCVGADPELLLLDEPFAGVAPPTIERITVLLASMSQAGIAIVIIDHNLRALERSAGTLIAMSAGRIIATGSTKEVLGSRAVLDAYLRPGPNV
jgi:branched-chain amino acid transport system ATP-binding protein